LDCRHHLALSHIRRDRPEKSPLSSISLKPGELAPGDIITIPLGITTSFQDRRRCTKTRTADEANHPIRDQELGTGDGNCRIHTSRIGENRDQFAASEKDATLWGLSCRQFNSGSHWGRQSLDWTGKPEQEPDLEFAALFAR